MHSHRKSLRVRLALTVGLLMAACAPAAQAASYVMFRDPSCGCCMAWRDHAKEHLDHEVQVREDVAMPEVKERLGVPADLASCHTTVIEGYVIEGHVPAREIKRLLKERPDYIRGLAVSGMPVGSPGMEMGNRTQPYQVIAFGDEGRSVYAAYP